MVCKFYFVASCCQKKNVSQIIVVYLTQCHGSSNRLQNTYTWTLEFAETPANLLPVEDDDDDDEDLDGGGDGAGDHHFRLPLLELADLCALDLNLGAVRHCCKVRTQQHGKHR